MKTSQEVWSELVRAVYVPESATLDLSRQKRWRVPLVFNFILCAEDAEAAWSINGKELNEEDEQYAISSCDGEQLLEIVQPLVSDTATFSCRSHLDKITSHLWPGFSNLEKRVRRRPLAKYRSQVRPSVHATALTALS